MTTSTLFCPYCSMDLRSTLEHIGNSSCPECGDAVDPSSAGHGALCMFSCCPESPYHIQCLSRVAVAEGDSVFCPRCQGGLRGRVDVGWFQRMCHINGVDWPVHPQVTCVLCMDSMGEDRVAVPCCNQEVHVGCLAQSFNACGARCPFCVQPLREFAESPVFQAAALFHGHSVDVTGQPTKRGTNSLVLPSGFSSPPENLSLLCCCRAGPPPQFEPSVDRRMEWSPVWQQSTMAWDLQWICVSCSRTVPAGDIPSCPQVPCGVCSDPSHMVVDFQSNERWNWCTRCQTRVPQEVRRTWFSHGLLASLGPLYGWGEHPITVPGQGPQSWLFCPIISLALAVVERARGVTPFSTGPRSVVPPAQEQYWMTHAAAIVDSLAGHFQSFSPQSQIAQVLQSQSSWVGGEHLSGPQQELCVPPSVLDSLSTWLATQCEQFASGPHQVAAVVSPSPFLNMQVETPVASPRSPFQNAVVNPIDTSGPGSPIVVSNPFVTMPVAAEPPPSQSTYPFQFPEGGPVRLTRFVEMPLDVYYARVNGMIQSGVFEDIGRATIRLGGTAWGVWLRIDHWSTALGRRPRLRCGVLYHLGNRTLSFHGIADDAVRLLIPLFEGWTSSSITQLPSVQSCRQSTHSSVPSMQSNHQSVPSNVPPPPLLHPVPRVMREQQLLQDDSSQRPQAPDRQMRGDDALRSMVHQLIDVCQVNQRHLTGLREEVTNLRSQITVLMSRMPVGVPTPISVATPVGDSPMAVPPPVPNAPVSGDSRRRRVCRRPVCDTAVPAGCCVQFCQAHCASPRCRVHGERARSRV